MLQAIRNVDVVESLLRFSSDYFSILNLNIYIFLVFSLLNDGIQEKKTTSQSE